MRKLDLNLTGVDTFEPIPPGEYPVEVELVEIRVREEEGATPYLNWTLKVVGGEYDDRRLWLTTSTLPQSLWKLKESLVAVGLGAEQLTIEWDEEQRVTSPPLKGLTAIAVVAQEQYQGRIQNRVLSLKAGGPSSSKTLRPHPSRASGALR